MAAPRLFDVREDGAGWTVFDVATGEPLALEAVPQTGLPHGAALQLARVLNEKIGRTLGPLN